MLEKLKREFALIALGLSGGVLLLALLLSLVTNWSTQTSITQSLLRQSLQDGVAVSPKMGSKDREGSVGADSMLTITVDVSSGGVMLSRSDSPVAIDEDDLREVVQQAVASPDEQGFDFGRHIA